MSVFLHYYVDYREPSFDQPYDLIATKLGSERNSVRYSFSYKRRIFDKKRGIQIGTATYLIHGTSVTVAENKKTGKIWADFTATHSFTTKNGKLYDVYYSGKLYFYLEELAEDKFIDPLAPLSNIRGVIFEHVAAERIFVNNKILNNSDYEAEILGTGQYKVKKVPMKPEIKSIGIVKRFNDLIGKLF
jgi:hypothetical protein